MRIFLKTLQLTKLKLKKENLKEIIQIIHNKVLFSLLFGDSKNVPQEFSSTLKKRSPIQVLVAINETAL